MSTLGQVRHPPAIQDFACEEAARRWIVWDGLYSSQEQAGLKLGMRCLGDQISGEAEALDGATGLLLGFGYPRLLDGIDSKAPMQGAL